VKSTQIENWVLSIIDRVSNGQNVEDSRVELKAEWPTDMNKVARRIAGHANASRGEPVLWIIGLHEEKGVVPVQPVELADWMMRLRKEFDAIVPEFKDVVVPHNEQQVTALLFDTTRAPYVVRNTKFNSDGGGPVQFEVPWRDGTRVRSARREDLIRLLVPLHDLPSVEVLSASVKARTEDTHWVCSFTLVLYITPQGTRSVVLPVHKSRVSIQAEGLEESLMFDFRFSISPYVNEIIPTLSGTTLSHTIQPTYGEAIINGPGTLYVRGSIKESIGRDFAGKPLVLSATFILAGSDKAVTLQSNLPPVQMDGPQHGEWLFEPAESFK
jgi:hypothetical protein